MGHQFTELERSRGRQAVLLRQVKHDERCRPALEKAARSKLPTIATARAFLRQANVRAPRGGEWTRTAVYRVAKRLGIELGTGRKFGQLLYCRDCGRGANTLKAVPGGGLCRRCVWKANRAKQHRGFKAAELAEARQKLAYYKSKVDALERGQRHYSRHHPEPRRRFGHPVDKVRQ